MQGTYIDIMLQSLKKKTEVLDRIMKLNELQKTQLEGADTPVEDFDKTVEDKAALLEQLEQLDSGFEKLFARVEDELKGNTAGHADEIRLMQEYIRHITDRSMQIQAQEARNKELMTLKFARIKKQSKAVRVNSKATTQYYKNMMKMNCVEPQFMDDKK